MKTIVIVLAAFIAVSQSAAETALPVNQWRNAVDGDWNVPGNWSLGHVPTEEETAFFPNSDVNYTVTLNGDTTCGTIYLDYREGNYQTVHLVGSGKLFCTYAGDYTNYIRPYRRLVVDGIEISLAQKMLNYGDLTLANGGVYSCQKNSFLWAPGASITISNGTFKTDSKLLINAKSTSVTLHSGNLEANIAHESGREDVANLKLTINGGRLAGDVTLGSDAVVAMNGGAARGALNLGESVTFEMNGGEWTVTSDVTRGGEALAEGVKLRLNGGTVVSLKNQVLTDRVWVEGSADFTFVHNRSNSSAANFSTFDMDTVETISTLVVTNGGIATSNATRFVGSGTIIARNFAVLSGGNPFIGTAKIVLGNAIENFDGNVFDSWTGNRRYALAGPMRIGAWTDWAARRSGVNIAAIDMTGDFTVDTTDYFDRLIGREIVLDRVNVRGCASLTVEGKGALRMCFDKNASPFDCIRLKSGVTFDPSLGLSSSRGPVVARTVLLESGAKIAVTAGGTWLQFDAIEISGTPVVDVTIPEGLAEGWYPIMQGPLGSTLPAAIVSAATLNGADSSWTIVERDGSLFAKKVTAAATGNYKHEWTGAAGSDSWADAQNWYCKIAPTWEAWPNSGNTKDLIPCFGALGSGVLWYDTSRDAATQFRWLLTADSFVLKARGTDGSSKPDRFMTINKNDIKGNSGLYSLASTPQYVDFPIRVLNRMTWCAAGRGPLVQRNYFLPSTTSAKSMTVQGDVRYQCSNTSNPLWAISLHDPYQDAPFTRFTVLSGGKLKIFHQDDYVDKECSLDLVPAPASSIRIDVGGELTFTDDTESARYQWKRAPADCVIDGLLDVKCPFLGSVDQTYRGVGTLRVGSTVPAGADTRVTIGGTLTLEAPGWTTEAAGSPYALGLSVVGTPVIKATADFTYGPASGASKGDNSAARSLTIAKGATLTVDGDGHAVSFEDPIAGEGCLLLTNGVFSAVGGLSDNGSLILAAGVRMAISSPLEVASLTFAPGSELYISSQGRLTVSGGTVNLSNLHLEVADGEASSWRELITVVNGDITGTFANGRYWSTKTVEDGGVKTLFVRKACGMRLIMR